MTSSRSSCSCRRAPGLPKERGCRLGSANAGSGTALELSPGLRLGALVWPALSWAPGSAVAAGPAAAGLRCNACICAAHCSQPRLLCCIVEMFRAEVWMTPWFHAAAASAWAAHLPRRHACSAQPAAPRTEATPAALALEQAPGGTDGYSQCPPRGICTQQVWRRARPAGAAGAATPAGHSKPRSTASGLRCHVRQRRRIRQRWCSCGASACGVSRPEALRARSGGLSAPAHRSMAGGGG